MKKYRIIESQGSFFYTQVLSTERCGFLWLKRKPCWRYLHYEWYDPGLNHTLKKAKEEIVELIKNEKKFANGNIIHEV